MERSRVVLATLFLLTQATAARAAEKYVDVHVPLRATTKTGMLGNIGGGRRVGGGRKIGGPMIGIP
jgi:hypothetical protein